MPRPRAFDVEAAVRAARDAFVRTGYAGTSVDDLVKASGMQRSSLYNAFGSKRGLFLAVLERATAGEIDLDVLVVALLDVAADDPAVRSRVAEALRAGVDDASRRLGERLLARGGIEPAALHGTDGSVPSEGGTRG